jgi:hypothetical protein
MEASRSDGLLNQLRRTFYHRGHGPGSRDEERGGASRSLSSKSLPKVLDKDANTPLSSSAAVESGSGAWMSVGQGRSRAALAPFASLFSRHSQEHIQSSSDPVTTRDGPLRSGSDSSVAASLSSSLPRSQTQSQTRLQARPHTHTQPQTTITSATSSHDSQNANGSWSQSIERRIANESATGIREDIDDSQSKSAHSIAPPGLGSSRNGGERDGPDLGGAS